MRRLVVELPPSSAALWSRRVAAFALAVVAIAVALSRFAQVEPPAALSVLAAGLVLAIAALVLATFAFAIIWDDGRPGFGAAVTGVVLALLLLAGPLFFAVQAVRLPRLNDITTDTSDLPEFSRSRKALAARGFRTPEPPPQAARVRQQLAYPGIASVTVDDGPAEAFAMALKAASQRGWEIVEAIPPGGRVGSGRIDAVDRTLLMRFPDDVTVRVRPVADGTRIDVRSASRWGTHDFGTNARRVQGYLDALEALVEAK
jgi:hypothetical protein